jgi:hypothetical protein
MVFLAFKTLLSPLGTGEKIKFVNFECYDLANGEEWVCRHVDIEVRYKILRLDVLNKTQILHNLSCFE